MVKIRGSALTKLAGFAVSLLAMAIALKYAGLSGSEFYAWVGGGILFFIIGVILGSIFDIELIPAFGASALVTALIMWVILPSFSLLMVALFFFMLIIAAAAQEG